jgi:hypothetical protein
MNQRVAPRFRVRRSADAPDIKELAKRWMMLLHIGRLSPSNSAIAPRKALPPPSQLRVSR